MLSVFFNPWVIITFLENAALESSVLDLALKFKDFQGNSLKYPWIFSWFNPWLVHSIPWKFQPWVDLELQGFSRITLEKSPNFLALQPLTWRQNFYKSLPLTWNTLDFRGRGQGSLWVKVSFGHPNWNKYQIEKVILYCIDSAFNWQSPIL